MRQEDTVIPTTASIVFISNVLSHLLRESREVPWLVGLRRMKFLVEVGRKKQVDKKKKQIGKWKGLQAGLCIQTQVHILR